MRRIRYTLYIIVLFISLSGCTRNDGDIGDWFGTWRVDDITIDGAVDTDYAPPYMIWKFQSSLIQIMVPDDFQHTSVSCYGTWEHNGTTLTLDFSHGLGTPPDFSMLEPKVQLSVLKLSRSKITLQYIDRSGRSIVYSLKKWG